MNDTKFFTAPGRTEIGGNHTDHQHGCVLAAAIDMQTRAKVRQNGTPFARVFSEGFAPVEVDLRDLAPREDERNTTTALVRGVAAAFSARGCALSGFDAEVSSTVLPGSGLSSSAAFEVLIGRILNGLFFDNRLTAVELAQIGQYAENVYFGKPCGLMDQMASSVGGMVSIDFRNPKEPLVERLNFDFTTCGYTLCIADTHASHAELTDAYASIPAQMSKVAGIFKCGCLREVDEAAFYQRLPQVRRQAGDRAALRAIHFFEENRRVQQQADALRAGEFETFLRLMNESGNSSWMYLQNVIPEGADSFQEMALTLAVCKKLLGGRGAVRVHGGGFAGTVVAFVPDALFGSFADAVDGILGKNSCHKLHVVTGEN